MRKLSLIFLLLIATIACAKEPRTTAELTRQGPNNIGIDGFSPVSYFSKGLAEKGSASFPVVHNGLHYWLIDEAQAKIFAAAPEKYLPVHGGWCSLMLTGSGNLAVADPQSYKIVNNRLLLFWSGTFNGNPINGMKNWESKFDNEKGERKLLAKADRTWNRLLSGRNTENVVFFSAADVERVNENRSVSGKKMYE